MTDNDAAVWHARWQDGRIGFHREAVNAHLLQHWPALAIAEQATVFVPLCGKSIDMHWLAERHRQVIGVELSALAAQAFFAEANLDCRQSTSGAFERYEARNIRLLCGDFFDLTAADLDGACAFFDRAALIALPADVRTDYQRHLAALLPASARGLTVTLDYPQHEMNGPPFAVTEVELRALCADRFALESLAQKDVLASEPRFRERGVTRMQEQVFRLTRSA